MSFRHHRNRVRFVRLCHAVASPDPEVKVKVLSDRRMKLLRFLDDAFAHGEQPTLSEMGRAMGEGLDETAVVLDELVIAQVVAVNREGFWVTPLGKRALQVAA